MKEMWLARVVWRAEKNETPGGGSDSHWWEVQICEEDGTSLLVHCNEQEATMKRDSESASGPLVVTRAHRSTWVKTSEIWRPADRMPPTVGARVEVSEHTGAVRVGTVLEPKGAKYRTEDGVTTLLPVESGSWMVDTGTHPIVWWRPVKWQLTRADVRVFFDQPIWKRRRLLLDAGVDVGSEDHTGRSWGQLVRLVVDTEEGDLPGFLTALRALAK